MTAAACPICRAPPARDHAPFCSPRCRDRDLLRWLGDGYALPGDAAGNETVPEALDSAYRRD